MTINRVKLTEEIADVTIEKHGFRDKDGRFIVPEDKHNEEADTTIRSLRERCLLVRNEPGALARRSFLQNEGRKESK